MEGREVVQLEVILQKCRNNQSFDQPHEFETRLKPAVRKIIELQISDPASVVCIGDDVHAPDAVHIGGIGRRSRRVESIMIVYRHLIEAVKPRHGERKHARAVRILAEVHTADQQVFVDDLEYVMQKPCQGDRDTSAEYSGPVRACPHYAARRS